MAGTAADYICLALRADKSTASRFPRSIAHFDTTLLTVRYRLRVTCDSDQLIASIRCFASCRVGRFRGKTGGTVNMVLRGTTVFDYLGTVVCVVYSVLSSDILVVYLLVF